MSELAKQIEQFNNELATQVPQEVLEAFGKSIKDLKQLKNASDNKKQLYTTIIGFILAALFFIVELYLLFYI